MLTGYSTTNTHESTVVIYRKEEAKKVLIHELIHALHLHCVHDSTIINTLLIS